MIPNCNLYIFSLTLLQQHHMQQLILALIVKAIRGQVLFEREVSSKKYVPTTIMPLSV